MSAKRALLENTENGLKYLRREPRFQIFVVANDGMLAFGGGGGVLLRIPSKSALRSNPSTCLGSFFLPLGFLSFYTCFGGRSPTWSSLRHCLL